MPMKQKFTIPYADVDPTFRHGGVDGELENQFVFPDLTDNWKTSNIDLLKIFRAVNMVATSISMHPVSDIEGYPDRNMVEEMLNGINFILENIVDKTHALNTRTHQWTHAIPPQNDFQVRAVRYPVRNSLAQEFLHYMIGLLVEISELNRNGFHAGLDPQSADRLISPIYAFKANLIKYYFDLEVAGEISANEMDTLLQGKFRPGPVVSMPDESAGLPEGNAVIEALSGTNVIQFAADDRLWIIFGNLQRKRYTAERILQPEGVRHVSEDVAPNNPLNKDGTPSVTTTDSSEQP